MLGTQQIEVTLRRRLRQYQTDGADWIYDRLSQRQDKGTRAVLLCDDPGLGKTVQTLLAMIRLGVERAVIAAPAVARRVWAREIAAWVPMWSSRILIIEPGVKLTAAEEAMLDTKDRLVLVSYATFSEARDNPTARRWAAALLKRHWDLLVLDEAHYLKGQSLRTRTIYGLRGNEEGLHARADKVLLLTGTPTPNHAGELYHHIRALWPDVLLMPNLQSGTADKATHHRLTEVEFQERVTNFKDTNFGRQVVRSKNVPWLRERMRPFVLHRSKARVLPELPPLVCQDIPLDIDPKHVGQGWTSGTQRVAGMLNNAGQRLSDDRFITTLHAAQAENRSTATIRHTLGLAKVEATVDYVHERLSCGVRKIILFGWHLQVLHRLHERLFEYDPVIITGETSPTGRVNAIELFQNRASVRVFVGQILACGTAVTLTAASEVAIVEPSWTPTENSQAIDRAHRLGQHDSVLASFLYIPGTLDQTIMRVFRRKAQDTQGLNWERVPTTTKQETSRHDCQNLGSHQLCLRA